jgi:hypothetical protein
VVLVAYFSSRAAHPSADEQRSGRLEPFLAGASGDYRQAGLSGAGAAEPGRRVRRRER